MPVKYRGITGAHPWVVVVIGRSATRVKLRVVEGPGHARDKKFWLAERAFALLYRPITKG